MNNDNNDNDNDNVPTILFERTNERANERTADRPTGRKTEIPIEAGRYLDYLFHISELSPRVHNM